jgi:hypothetical protein
LLLGCSLDILIRFVGEEKGKLGRGLGLRDVGVEGVRRKWPRLAGRKEFGA